MSRDIKKYKNIMMSALAVISILIVACNNDPKATDPKPTEDVQLAFKFTSSIGTGSIDFNKDYIITTSQDTIKPNKFKFIFSNFRVVKMDNTELTFPNKYGFISYTDNATDFVLPELPAGSYKGIKFTVGLDSATNHGDPSQWPANHPLNPLKNGMHWSWQGGYIFMTHEGTFSNKGADDSYTFHIATLPFSNEISVEFPYNHVQGKNDIIAVNCDLAKYFDGVNAFSLQNDISGSHSNSAQAVYINKLRENIRLMFSGNVK
jgi:hypothetical protein